MIIKKADTGMHEGTEQHAAIKRSHLEYLKDEHKSHKTKMATLNRLTGENCRPPPRLSVIAQADADRDNLHLRLNQLLCAAEPAKHHPEPDRNMNTAAPLCWNSQFNCSAHTQEPSACACYLQVISNGAVIQIQLFDATEMDINKIL